MAYKHRHLILFLIVCGVVVSVILTAVILLKKSPSELFRRYILDPIPKSVTQIRAHGPWKLTGHKCVFKFDVDKADLELIISSKQFKEVMGVEYMKNGILRWWETNPSYSESLILYAPYRGKPGPDWFRPDRWDSPKVYVFKEGLKRKQTRILMYNEESGQVYFIEYKMGY